MVKRTRFIVTLYVQFLHVTSRVGCEVQKEHWHYVATHIVLQHFFTRIIQAERKINTMKNSPQACNAFVSNAGTISNAQLAEFSTHTLQFVVYSDRGVRCTFVVRPQYYIAAWCFVTVVIILF